ncbi:MAG: glycosyltransferase family 4 protein [Myxococcota bacterium]|nr:glycosyltransferase family 4 protein [Myxococcota bacterium]
MHVLQITPYFPPTWAYGGIPRIVDGLSRALVEEGVEVTVLTTDAFDAARRSGVSSARDHHGVTVHTVKNVSNRLAYRHQLFLPRGVAGVLAGLPEVDVVHLHGHRHLLNNAAVRWAQSRNVPYVLTANGTLLRHERKVGAKWLWDAVVAGHIPASAARCIAVSRADAAMHHKAGISAERVRLIPNGLDLGEFDPLPRRGSFRQRHGLPQGPLVVYLGQISPRKGVEHLVAAFADGAPGGSTLVVAGNDMGGLAAAQAALKPDSPVRFVGLLEGRERLELLADADVLVYASTAEVFGLVPFEGLLCGAPVVVGDDCGCGELIAESGAGLLVRHGDVAGLRARIRTLLLDRVAAEAMVSRGRRYIRQRLGFAPIARQHHALYSEVTTA